MLIYTMTLAIERPLTFLMPSVLSPLITKQLDMVSLWSVRKGSWKVLVESASYSLLLLFLLSSLYFLRFLQKVYTSLTVPHPGCPEELPGETLIKPCPQGSDLINAGGGRLCCLSSGDSLVSLHCGQPLRWLNTKAPAP